LDFVVLLGLGEGGRERGYFGTDPRVTERQRKKGGDKRRNDESVLVNQKKGKKLNIEIFL